MERESAPAPLGAVLCAARRVPPCSCDSYELPGHVLRLPFHLNELLRFGTVTPPANGFLTAPLRGQGSFAIDTAGQREDTTNWLVNGINLSDPQQNQITFQPPVDTLSE